MIKYLKQRLYTKLNRNGNRRQVVVVYNSAGEKLRVLEEDDRLLFPQGQSGWLSDYKVSATQLTGEVKYAPSGEQSVVSSYRTNMPALVSDLLTHLITVGIQNKRIEDVSVRFVDDSGEVLLITSIAMAALYLRDELYWDDEGNWGTAVAIELVDN